MYKRTSLGQPLKSRATKRLCYKRLLVAACDSPYGPAPPFARAPSARSCGVVEALPEVLEARCQCFTGTVEGKKSRPVSRVLSWTVIPLGLTSPSGSSNLPGSSAGHANAPLFGLAPSGVCHATRRCPRARCALTAPFHPYHACLATPFGGLFSVALAVGSRRPGVTWHSALWSPDFPRDACASRDCLADSTVILTRMDAIRPRLPGHAVVLATRSIAAMLASTSTSRVAQDETLIRIAVRPCQTVPPHQQVPSACSAAITRWVRAASPNATST